MIGDLGERLSYYLKVKKINQKDFAKLCGINEASLCRYISGEREPKYKTVMKMAYNLGVSVDELTGMNGILIEKYTKEIDSV